MIRSSDSLQNVRHASKLLVKNVKERDYLGGIGVDVRIILKQVL
jgi:hypothetical protein